MAGHHIAVKIKNYHIKVLKTLQFPLLSLLFIYSLCVNYFCVLPSHYLVNPLSMRVVCMKIISVLSVVLLMPNLVYSADPGSPRPGTPRLGSPVIQRIKAQSQKSPRDTDIPLGHFGKSSGTMSSNSQPKKDLSQSAPRIEPKPTKVKILNQ